MFSQIPGQKPRILTTCLLEESGNVQYSNSISIMLNEGYPVKK